MRQRLSLFAKKTIYAGFHNVSANFQEIGLFCLSQSMVTCGCFLDILEAFWNQGMYWWIGSSKIDMDSNK